MKILNIAVHSKDGRVEVDTIYRKEMFTQEEVKELSDKFNLDVIVTCVGTAVFDSEDEIENSCIIYKRPKEVEDGKVEISDSV